MPKQYAVPTDTTPDPTVKLSKSGLQQKLLTAK